MSWSQGSVFTCEARPAWRGGLAKNFAANLRLSSPKIVQMPKKVDVTPIVRHTPDPIQDFGGQAHGGDPRITRT